MAETHQPPVPPEASGPESTSGPRKISRRGLGRLAVGGAAAAAGVDLSSRRVLQPILEGIKGDSIEEKLIVQAKKSIPYIR